MKIDIYCLINILPCLPFKLIVITELFISSFAFMLKICIPTCGVVYSVESTVIITIFLLLIFQ